MSRRTGQSGNVYQPHAKTKSWEPQSPAYGRYLVDVLGGDRKRVTVALGRCPTRTIARQRLREHIDREGINSKQSFTTNTAPGTTFRQQAERWIESLSTRRRRPVKPATISSFRDALNAWLLPHLGDRLLSDVSNGVLRELVEKMTVAGLAAKSIVNYVQVAKMVVASVVNDEGEQVYPRKWNHDFIGLPVVDKTKQHRPTVTRAEIEVILSRAKPQFALLFALLAGTGLRIGEALGLKTTDFSSDYRVLQVRRSIWRGREQAPKTSAAVRVVDVPGELAHILRANIIGDSYLFSTRKGRPPGQRYVLRVLHATGTKVGFHAFRRYRASVLRRARVPEDLITLWLGHAKNLTDRYAEQLRDDVGFRTEWVDRAGLGFEIGYIGYKNVVPIDAVDVA